MPDIFKDFIPSILQTKKNVIDTTDDEKDYVPFVINRALSFHLDCILQANEMNIYPSLDKKLQYQYLINIIRSWKRPFQKWIKQEKISDLEVVKEYYQYSNEKAKEALKLLTSDHINEIKRRLNKGGINNDKSRRIGMVPT